MKRLALIAPLVMASAATTSAQAHDFAPKNDLHLEDYKFLNNSNIDEAAFNAIIESVEKHYQPIVAAFGAKLNVERKWTDPTVNAYAEQIGDTWNVAMFGGLARRPETTPDGFALVVCHELGHHIAGFAFYGDADWASSEGNSDYFATLACSRKIWGDDLEGNAAAKATAHPTVIAKCDESWSEEADRNLCYRTAMGGKSLAELLASLGGESVDFDHPDMNEVRTSDAAHPAAQCRMDTYFAGALCGAQWDETVIPGKDHADGNNSLGAEAIAAKYSCMAAGGHSKGLRPRCWYNPRLSVNFDKSAMKIDEVTGNGNGAWEPGETFAVNVPLRNSLMTSVTKATLSLSSDNNDVQVENTANYPEIAAGDLGYAETGVNVAIASDLACGSRFALNARADLGGAIVAEKVDFLVGKNTDLISYSEVVNVGIPDNDRKGAKIVHDFDIAGEALSATVALDVQHSYPGDLTFKLVSPAGKEYVFFRGEGAGGPGVKGEFQIDLGSEAVKGAWQLVFLDGATIDVGTVKSYGITFHSATCEGGVTISRFR